LKYLGIVSRTIAVASLAFAIAAGGLLVGPTPTSAFTGHGCTKQTCSYFTSSYHTAKYYYKRCDSAWRNLSNTYLEGFTTKTALLNRYPNRVLHKRC
jgi:hypothetical protein